MKKMFTFVLMINLLASSAMAGEAADYLGSEEAFLKTYPEAIEIRPGVYQVAVDESRTRTYAFGREGMQYELERMQELVLRERRNSKSLERSEHEEAYWALSGVKEEGGADVGLQADDSGNICARINYDLEALAWGTFYNSHATADSGFEYEWILPGPPPTYYPTSVLLHAYAFAEHENDSASDGGTAGPFSPTDDASINASASTFDFYENCMYSTATAWISVSGNGCPAPTFRSVTENFSHPSGCNQ